MQIKTMEKVLKGTFDRWVTSIDDENVRKMVEQNTIITGGCFVSMLQNEEVNDFDIYFRNRETVMAVALYYVKKRKGANTIYNNNLDSVEQIPNFCVKTEGDRVSVFVRSAGIIKGIPGKKKDFFPVYFTDNAITLTAKIQLVLRFYGEPEEIHKNYDFVHTTNYWTSWGGKVVLNVPALDAIINKNLVYQGSKYPICSVIRTRKFIQRGWTINAGQYLKMCWQIHKMDLSDIKVLSDQLVGVDATYFGWLIEKLESMEKNNEDITDDVIVSLIDEIFNGNLERTKEEESLSEEQQESLQYESI